MSLLVSKLNKKIILQGQDESCGDWHEVMRASAAINAISEMKYMGIEVFRSMQLMSTNPYLFTIRYREGVNLGMRILYGKRIFSIKRIINPNESNVMLKIITEEENL